MKFVIICDGTETVWLTPLRRILASSPEFECNGCHQQGHENRKT